MKMFSRVLISLLLFSAVSYGSDQKKVRNDCAANLRRAFASKNGLFTQLDVKNKNICLIKSIKDGFITCEHGFTIPAQMLIDAGAKFCFIAREDGVVARAFIFPKRL